MRRVAMMIGSLVFAGSLMVSWTMPVRADEPAPGAAKENYERYCQKCHGEQGKGDGPGAAMLNPKPRDYTDCKVMQNKKDDELIKVITDGGESIGMSADMQPWGGTLSAEEIKQLVKYVRGFCKQP
jgi:mono/diheme cytochrome c family protein